VAKQSKLAMNTIMVNIMEAFCSGVAALRCVHNS
jgi:hypothetical protein